MMTSSNGTFSALPVFCAGNSPVTGEFPAQRPVTRSFDVFFDLRLNKRWSKQSWGWWFETPSRSLWRPGKFPAQMASNAEKFSIWWRHHVRKMVPCLPWTSITNVCTRARVETWYIVQSIGNTLYHWLTPLWWRHDMDTLSALLSLCEGGISHKGIMGNDAELWRFLCFRLDKVLSKQSSCQWSETHWDSREATLTCWSCWSWFST